LNLNLMKKNTKNKLSVCETHGDKDIDIEMLKANLKRSVSERIRRHDIALATVRQLQKAKKL
jgi:hypothetical protein